MRWIDLGTQDAPLLLFGGPYSNLYALDALLEAGARAGIPTARMICTGDVVAYGAAPGETVARIRAAGCTVIAGNVERQLGAGEGDCGCGFSPGSTCDRLSAGWFAHADAAVSAEDRAWMADLPGMAVFRHQGARYAVIHGGARDVSRFIWECDAEEVFAEELAAIAEMVGPVDGVIAGHAGLPFVRQVGGATWINAGVIGMPPHDGAPATRFAVLEHGRARIERLDYDHAGARAAMVAAGLTQGYDRALETGYWPSEDVLPAVLRVATSDRG
ncbi:metallophosphoesterase family protein [Roseovarius aquimarinus]|uniref:Metallophosphoesterase family protein n=1 Tax=Roseovarius aquimarinus TaxID=1229156 RepID=A0ABW7I323_9RHOB